MFPRHHRSALCRISLQVLLLAFVRVIWPLLQDRLAEFRPLSYNMPSTPAGPLPQGTLSYGGFFYARAGRP
jgi:hypothetical protein